MVKTLSQMSFFSMASRELLSTIPSSCKMPNNTDQSMRASTHDSVSTLVFSLRMLMTL